MKLAFGSYKNIEEAAKKHQISVAVEPYIQPLPIAIDEHFQRELAYVLQQLDVKMSEASISEFLIAPILKEIWKHYDDSLSLWSHVSLSVGAEFEGYPDYLFTRRSPLCPACGSDKIKKALRNWTGKVQGKTYNVPNLALVVRRCPKETRMSGLASLIAQHFVQAVESGSVRLEPFPHLVVDGALPADVFRRVSDELPSLPLPRHRPLRAFRPGGKAARPGG
ncbi:MAG: hypothetical protein MOB07_02050 [Acidobacteria bacterium]|nr:hypothetical protein [Acidobacteriota bacterium]